MTKQIRDMISRAATILDRAYTPYSNYQVACCIKTDNGQFYSGVNVENAAFPLTSCAEACAIGQMVADGQQCIKTIVILNHEGSICPPCGGCRQRIYEFSTEDTKILLCDHEKVIKSLNMSELLPHAFKFKP